MSRRFKNTLCTITAIIMSIVMAGVFCACSFLATKSGEDATDSSYTEAVIIEDTVIEDLVISEEYIEDLFLVEEEISNILIEDESIEDVILCRTIYVAQDHIHDFAEHSSTAELFSESLNWESLLTKIAIGTGVIISLVVLSKVGLAQPVASVVAAAAPAALKGAAIGAGVGSLIGGLTGATDEIDETGRTSSIIGFSLAVVGVILATVSLIAEIPSGGSSSITAAMGVKIAIAGITLAASVASATYYGYNMVKTLNSTDATDIDWDNVDWEKVGVSAALHSIEGAADGYMWGSIFGAVRGGAEGLDFWEKFHAPYSTYAARLQHTPIDPEIGHWTGERGESTFVLKKPIVLKNGKVITEISYKNAIPDFEPHQIAKVTIRNMSDKRYSKGGNFDQANKKLAKMWTKSKFNGQENWTAQDVSKYIQENNLTWHEMNNMRSMQLVPTEVNATFTHLGGVSEYRTMISSLGGVYD